MMRKSEIVFALAALLGSPASAQSITVERGPCLGTCPVYRFEATAAGTGVFEGRRLTTVLGEQRFSFTQQEWSTFQAALAPFQPQGTEEITAGHPRCKPMATDHASVSVTWAEGGRTDRLFFNFGCMQAENAAMARALADAPDLLPVGKLIEERHLEDGAWDRHPFDGQMP